MILQESTGHEKCEKIPNNNTAFYKQYKTAKRPNPSTTVNEVQH